MCATIAGSWGLLLRLPMEVSAESELLLLQVVLFDSEVEFARCFCNPRASSSLSADLDGAVEIAQLRGRRCRSVSVLLTSGGATGRGPAWCVPREMVRKSMCLRRSRDCVEHASSCFPAAYQRLADSEQDVVEVGLERLPKRLAEPDMHGCGILAQQESRHQPETAAARPDS